MREGEYEQLAPEIKSYEPREALLAGKDGLNFIKSLLTRAHDLLLENGWLIFEIGIDMEKSCENLLIKKGYKNIEVIPDLMGNPRVMVCKR